MGEVLLEEWQQELQQELDVDTAFINKVMDRIENEDWEESIPEPEWIYQMTEIAEKYLMRFKAAESVRINLNNK